MENQRISFFTRLQWSVSSFKDYGRMIRQSVGKAILYLTLLSLLLGGIGLIRTLYDFNTGISSFIRTFESNVPDFTFKNGKLSVSGNMPITVNDGNTVIIIDTTGKTNEQVLEKYDTGILVLSDRMIQKQAFNTRVTDFSSLVGLTLDKSHVSGWLPVIKWFSIFIVIFGLIGFFLGKLFSALIVSVIGLIVNSVVKAGLSYGNIFKISIYALTLPILLKVILGLVSVTIPFFWLIYYGFAVFYLWMAMVAIRQQTPVETIE